MERADRAPRARCAGPAPPAERDLHGARWRGDTHLARRLLRPRRADPRAKRRRGATRLPRIPRLDAHTRNGRMSEPVTSEQIELTMLREFYQSWEAMHEVPNDKAHLDRKSVV